jgi:hypothetical protein
MAEQRSVAGLRAFARECLAADRYPQDRHTWRLFTCEACGAGSFAVVLEHHSGSKTGDFKGVIWGTCQACGRRQQLFRFTGEHRQRLRNEAPACRCGGQTFCVGEYERIEGDGGLVGFFDEGVVVGQCCQCGRSQAFVYTD